MTKKLTIRSLSLICSRAELAALSAGKKLINTINAHSFNVAQDDDLFREALVNGDALIPDGKSIVWACRFLSADTRPSERIAGWDLFECEMEKLQRSGGGKCFFLGSSQPVLDKIKERAAADYPSITVETYSPPFKPEFSAEDDRSMIQAVNDADPDILWIGMTAPKQEKWAYRHWSELDIHCHCGTIGAVFDFYAGTVKRAPEWMQKAGLEWLHRLVSNPRRLWRRYILGNSKFIASVIKERKEKS